MKFSYNWLNSFFKKDLPEPSKLGDKLMMRFFEVEKIQNLPEDVLIDIDVLPNRAADCFSHLGVAKEISGLYEQEMLEIEDGFSEGNDQLSELVKLEVKDENLCPRYVLRGVKDVKIKETPEFIKRRLETCGLQSINNVVDITNYVMLETGQPLHAFDGDKIEEDRIVVRRAEENESITTLDDVDYDLDEDILVIADGKDPIGIAGVKGGKKAEITKDTSKIYVEAANFNSKNIRKSSRKLKLRTDASSRFEHGLSSSLAERASRRAIYLLEKYADGTPLVDSIDFYPTKETRTVLKLSYEKVRNLLGINIKKKEINSILKRLDFNPEDEGGKVKVTTPEVRKDIQLEEDLIEEVGRVYGYENIEPRRPKSAITPPEENYFLQWCDKARDILKGLGYNETYNYSFLNEELRDVFGYENVVKMENPVSSEHKFLRPSLRPHLLTNIKENEELFNKISFFEIGKVFIKQKEDKPKENHILSGIKSDVNFLEMKGDLEVLFEKLGIGKANFSNLEEDGFWGLRSAKISLRQEEIGKLGEVSEKICNDMKIKSSIILFELNADKLIELASGQNQYEKISRFPTAVKDLSVLVPKEVKYEEVLRKAENAAGDLLVDVDLFDIYQGEGIPNEKKNLGLRFFLQSEEKTLSKKEISNLLDKIISSLEDNSGWEVRKNK